LGFSDAGGLGLGGRLIADAGALILKGLFLTTRAERFGFEAVEALHAAGRRVVFAFWHGRLLLPLASFRGAGTCVLVSRHADGGLIARAVSRFGFATARGSSTRGGAAGVREMLRNASSGRDLVFTPDGPRGPAGRVQPGVVFVARETGMPIVPVGLAVTRAFEFSSWDRFQVPKPFSRVAIVFRAPIEVPAGLPESELERVRRRVEGEMIEATADAERRAGRRQE